MFVPFFPGVIRKLSYLGFKKKKLNKKVFEKIRNIQILTF